MSAQRLGARKTRRIAEATGLDVIRAWSGFHGIDGDFVNFVTRDHVHGWMERRTGKWGITRNVPTHFDTCRLIDPSEPSGYRSP